MHKEFETVYGDPVSKRIPQVKTALFVLFGAVAIRLFANHLRLAENGYVTNVVAAAFIPIGSRFFFNLSSACSTLSVVMMILVLSQNGRSLGRLTAPTQECVASLDIDNESILFTYCLWKKHKRKVIYHITREAAVTVQPLSVFGWVDISRDAIQAVNCSTYALKITGCPTITYEDTKGRTSIKHPAFHTMYIWIPRKLENEVNQFVEMNWVKEAENR